MANLQRTQSVQSVQSYETYQTYQTYQSSEQTSPTTPPVPTLRRPHLNLPHASSLSIVTNNSYSTSPSSSGSGSGSSAYSMHDLHSVRSSAASTHSSVELDPPSPVSTSAASSTYPSSTYTSSHDSVESYASTLRSSPSHRMMVSNNHIRQNASLPYDQKSVVSATTVSLPTVYEDPEYVSFIDWS